MLFPGQQQQQYQLLIDLLSSKFWEWVPTICVLTSSLSNFGALTLKMLQYKANLQELYLSLPSFFFFLFFFPVSKFSGTLSMINDQPLNE